jgi:hypothetical protein
MNVSMVRYMRVKQTYRDPCRNLRAGDGSPIRGTAHEAYESINAYPVGGCRATDDNRCYMVGRGIRDSDSVAS